MLSFGTNEVETDCVWLTEGNLVLKMEMICH